MQQYQQHQTVMLTWAVDALLGSRCGFYIDGTFGRGGHTQLLLSRLEASGRVLALDCDPQAADVAGLIDDPRFFFRQTRFGDMGDLAMPGSVDGILLDVGVSSPQIDTPERGFSFRLDGPLDMRMNPSEGKSAADFLAQASVQEIARVIKVYGEERFAAQIARAIVARRQEKPLQRTSELAKLVASVVKTHEPGQDPATRTFQALRIHINGELNELERALNASVVLLKPQGRLVVISFHSLEDRLVKQFMVKHSRYEPDRRVPFVQEPALMFKDVRRFKPTPEEVLQNPRARSAMMRVATRTCAVWRENDSSHIATRDEL